MRALLAALALLVVASAAPAQTPPKAPEHLLPADSLIYFRYDGYQAHRKAYDQTALAAVMKEGLGDFFDHLFTQLFTVAGGDFPPRNRVKAKGAGPEVEAFLDFLTRQGFALSLEVAPAGRALARGDLLAQLTLVFPEGAEKKNRLALERFFRLVPEATKTPMQESTHAGRAVRSFLLGEFQAAWWTEGRHLVFTLGVQPIERSLRVIDGRRPNVTAAAWYPELANFQGYETDMRGHVDLEGIIDRLAVVGLDPPGLDNLKDHLARHLVLRHLGVNGLKQLTFHLGFDGKYQRSTVNLGVVAPEKRSGLLHLMSGPDGRVGSTPRIGKAQLPPLPPDTDYVSVRQIDWEDVYDYLRITYGLFAIARLFEGELPDRFPDMDRLLGVDFRKDFLEQLEPSVVTWGAHSEGPFFLGQACAIRVKDAAKVRKSLAAITKKLGETDESLVAETRMFRGQELQVFSKFYLPITFTVHNDWLVVGLFPQPVQGFVLRSGGKYRTWKAPIELDEALAKERKANGKSKLLAMSVSDPRPVVEIGLALLPTWIQILNQSTGTDILDVSKVPNAQTVNEWLFPNVMLCYDDGNALRWENHYSINEPDDFLLLALSPVAVQMVDIVPFLMPRRRPRPPTTAMRGGELVDPQVPIPAFPAANEPSAPTLGPATASERDGVVHLQITIRRAVPYTVTKMVVETRFRDIVDKKGNVRKIAYTVTTPVNEVFYKDVLVPRTFIVDGKNVQVTRKDGRAVERRDLLMLLAKETQVLIVTGETIEPEQLQRLDDRTLIVRVPSGFDSLDPPR